MLLPHCRGSFNSLERLTHERLVFFSSPYSLGRRHLRPQVQTEPLCEGIAYPFDPASPHKVKMGCVENRRWTYGEVTYATMNIQGSCNNLCGDASDTSEY